jgi:NAD(P)-dependent dehydrogenase (short-subunit alcohol dehydrogenase family)
MPFERPTTDPNDLYYRDRVLLSFLAESSTFNHVGTPQAIADVVGFLVSEEARWITGQEIRVNGGATA